MTHSKDVKSEAVAIGAAEPENAVALSDLSYRSKAQWGYSDEFMLACKNELKKNAVYRKS